jgi:anti-anti-sigma factor
VTEFSEIAFQGAVIVSAAGRVDLPTAEAFKDALLAAVAVADSAVVSDLSDLEYISSAGLRSLVVASKAAKDKGVGFGVAGLRPLVLEVFTITRLHVVFALFPTAREAVAKLAPEALAAFDASQN